MIFRAFIVSILLLLSTSAFSAGGTTHLYIAEQTYNALPEGELKSILTEYHNDYLTGSNYPDAGYLKDATYGETSHWDPFLTAFSQHLNQSSLSARKNQPRLIAFLMGVATHRLSDELWHWTFLNNLAKHDFDNNWEAAHEAADIGFDFILAVEKQIPEFKWQVPVGDLINVYQTMGLQVSQEEIINSNFAYDTLLRAERATASLMYYPYKLKMPWGAAHYNDDNIGGLQHIAKDTLPLLEQLWLGLS